MPRCGPAITHAELDLHTVQVFADGDALVQVRRDPLRRVWLLPNPDADDHVCGTAAKALKQIRWDAEHLSHTGFAERYPGFMPCVARRVDESAWAVDRAGVLIAAIIRDPDTGRWVLLGPDRRPVRVPAAPHGWNYPESAVEHVLNNTGWFVTEAELTMGVTE